MTGAPTDCDQPLPTIHWLGEGEDVYLLEPGFDTFIVKRLNPFRFEREAGEINENGQRVYQAQARERVWSCSGNCDLVTRYQESFDLGTMAAGSRVEMVVIDDDGPEQKNDQRKNWWAADDPLQPQLIVEDQQLVEYLVFDVPFSAHWYFYAADSVALRAICLAPSTPTPTLTETASATPPPTFTATSTPTVTASPTASSTPTPSATPTATSTIPVLPTIGTATPTPTVRPPTALALLYFTAAPRSLASGQIAIDLQWETAFELDLYGFHLWRSTTADRSGAELITPSLIVASGGASSGAAYQYRDTAVQWGVTYTYWLEKVEAGGQSADLQSRSATVNSVQYLPWVAR
ncbi:MAG: hypothetical protein R2932_00215 [Caldilineaceae bacterium]